MPARKDNELVSAIGRGEDEALCELLDAHGGWMLAVARRFVRDPELANDAVQESLIHLVERASGVMIAESVRPWLYSVIRFRAMDQQRKAGRVSQIPEGRTEASDGNQGGFADLPDEPNAKLRAGVEQLPEALRETLILRVVDGLSVGQVAIALGVPEGTVKSRLHAALGRLREHPGLREVLGDGKS